MSLPDLPYMRPVAMSMPTVYESQLTYYEYLNNLHDYLVNVVKPAIEEMESVVDDYPTLKGRVSTLETTVITLANEIETMQTALELTDGKVAENTTKIANHTTRLNNVDNQISDIAESITDLVEDIATIETEIDELSNRISDNTSSINTIKKGIVFRKSVNFDLGDTEFALDTLFPNTTYEQLCGKHIKIVFDFENGTNFSANAIQSFAIGDDYKTLNLSKLSTSLQLSGTKSYVIDLQFVKVISSYSGWIDIFARVSGDCTTFSAYGGHITLGNTSFTDQVIGKITFNGMLGTGGIKVYYEN